MVKVLITTKTFAKFAPEAIELLKKNDFVIKQLIDPDEQTIKQEIVDSDALIVGLEKITESVLREAEKLKIIAKHGIGVDNIDIGAAKAKNIMIANSPHASSNAVAELTVGLIYCLSRKIIRADDLVRKGQWQPVVGTELNGKVMGLIGLGAIGKAVANKVRSLGMQVKAYDIAYSQEDMQDIDMCSNLDSLAKSSDFVSLHVPLTKGTSGIISEQFLELMKPTSYIINTSRGGLVDEKALCKALRNNLIAGAALDVFDLEPLDNNSPLLELDNILLTPHMGGYSAEALAATSIITAKNVVSALIDGKPLYELFNN